MCCTLCGMMRITSLAFLDIIIVDVRQGNPQERAWNSHYANSVWYCGSVNCNARQWCGEFWYRHSVYKCLDITMWYCMDWYNMGQACDCHWQCVLLQAGDGGDGDGGVDGNDGGGGGDCRPKGNLSNHPPRHALHLNSRPGSTGEVSAKHTAHRRCPVWQMSVAVWQMSTLPGLAEYGTQRALEARQMSAPSHEQETMLPINMNTHVPYIYRPL